MFRVQNRVLLARFLTLPAAVVPRTGKVVKIRPKHLSIFLTGYNMNMTTKYVGMFRKQTESFETDFPLTCSSGARARKSRQNSTKTVFSNMDDKR